LLILLVVVVAEVIFIRTLELILMVAAEGAVEQAVVQA